VSHSNRLLQEISECLEEASVSLNDVELFAAASGPGSFTGLRIGIATVKALAATSGRPCVGIPTLRAIARGAGPSSETVALLPAGRGEMFAQLLSVSPEGVVTDVDTAAHLAPVQVIERYAYLSTVRWAGPGAQIHREFLRDAAQKKAIKFREGVTDINEESEAGWIVTPEITNLGEQVAALAFEQWKREEVVTPNHLSAVYVRPSDAELKCQ